MGLSMQKLRGSRQRTKQQTQADMHTNTYTYTVAVAQTKLGMSMRQGHLKLLNMPRSGWLKLASDGLGYSPD